LARQRSNGENRKQVERADANRIRRQLAIRELDRLLKQAIEPDFTGTISVRLASKSGVLNRPIATCERWAEEP